MSYGVYAQHNVAYTLILLGVTAVTYVFAIRMERSEDKHRRRLLAVCGGLLALLPLLVFKYYNFIIASGNALLECIHFDTSLPGLNWAIPLGISFFTFQAVGYLLDVYHGRIRAERNWWDYMLFVSFFPQVMSGPISDNFARAVPLFRSCGTKLFTLMVPLISELWYRYRKSEMSVVMRCSIRTVA